jgi:hypothetical protein
MRDVSSHAEPSNADGGSPLLAGIAIGITFAVLQLRAYQRGRLRGAEEVCDLIVAYRNGVRVGLRPRVTREAPAA